MKVFGKFSFIFGALVLASSVSFASGTRNHDCIARALQAYDSDIYYNLTPAQVDELMDNEMPGHDLALRLAAEVCGSSIQ